MRVLQSTTEGLLSNCGARWFSVAKYGETSPYLLTPNNTRLPLAQYGSPSGLAQE